MCEARTRAALGAVVLLIALAAATPAYAAESVVGFDVFPGGGEVPAGTLVGGQWEAVGLKLGTAEEFSQPSVAGDCGKPTVEREATVPAASAPNFAVLPVCTGAFNTQGTFGALVGPARGALSVEVRNLTSTPNVEVSVTGYSGGGEVVAEGHGEATSGAWQRIAATLNGKGQISYFAIATALVTSQQVAIDDLSFEAPPPPPTVTPPAPPAPGPTPPTASLALATPDPSGGQPITLSAAGSTPGNGRIVSYGWNFRGGEQEETSTGTDPDAHTMFAPGEHTVTLIVTNSSHEHATTHLDILVPQTRESPHPRRRRR